MSWVAISQPVTKKPWHHFPSCCLAHRSTRPRPTTSVQEVEEHQEPDRTYSCKISCIIVALSPAAAQLMGFKCTGSRFGGGSKATLKIKIQYYLQYRIRKTGTGFKNRYVAFSLDQVSDVGKNSKATAYLTPVKNNLTCCHAEANLFEGRSRLIYYVASGKRRNIVYSLTLKPQSHLILLVHGNGSYHATELIDDNYMRYLYEFEV